jgi:uncharacterized protein DUF397
MNDVPRAHWWKSSRGGTTGNCVEVAPFAETIAVRDSKDPQGLTLAVAPGSWTAFIGAIQSNELDG